VVEKPCLFTVAQARIAPGLLYAGLDYEFDVVHAHAGNPPAPFGALGYSRLKGVPLIVTYHGDPQANYGSRFRQFAVKRYQASPLRVLLRRADVVLVPSINFLQDSRVLPRLGLDCEELPNGISIANYQSVDKEEARTRVFVPKDDFVVLYLGSLNPYKSPDVLLRAAELLIPRDPSFRFVFAGEGILRESLARKAAALGFKEQIRFDGYVRSEIKSSYFAAADVFVLPSTLPQEVFPIAILEAFAAGLPVIVSDLNTFQRVVTPGKNGLVVQRGDAHALAGALLALRRDEVTRKELAMGALESAKVFDWESIGRRAESIYLRLVKLRSSGRV